MTGPSGATETVPPGPTETASRAATAREAEPGFGKGSLQGSIQGPVRGSGSGPVREQALWTRATLGRDGRPLDLLTARFDRHRYAPHAHDEFTIGVNVG